MPRLPSANIAAIADRIIPANSETAVRQATPEDEPFVRALFCDVHATAFVNMGIPKVTVAMMLNLQFRAQQVGYAQSYPDAEYLIIEQAGAPIGRLTLSLGARESGRTLHIIDIAILTAARGQGIGTQVISGLGCAARKMGATQLTLSVMLTNVSARRLYERLEFIVTDVGTNIAMVKRLPR